MLLLNKKKFGVTVSAEKRKEAWAVVTEQMQAVGTAQRTSAQVEKKWADLRQRSTTNLGIYKKEMAKTGKHSLLLAIIECLTKLNLQHVLYCDSHFY